MHVQAGPQTQRHWFYCIVL